MSVLGPVSRDLTRAHSLLIVDWLPIWQVLKRTQYLPHQNKLSLELKLGIVHGFGAEIVFLEREFSCGIWYQKGDASGVFISTRQGVAVQEVTQELGLTESGFALSPTKHIQYFHEKSF